MKAEALKLAAYITLFMISKCFNATLVEVTGEYDLFSREALFILPRSYLRQPRKGPIFDSKTHNEEFGIILLDKKDDTKLLNLFRSGPFVEFHGHALFFQPQSEQNFFKWLGMIVSRFTKSTWYPITIFKWPFVEELELNATQGCNIAALVSTYGKKIQLYLTGRIAPLFHTFVDIRTNIYFSFHMRIGSGEKDCGGGNYSDIIRSIWEVYYINGYDDYTLVVQEVRDADENDGVIPKTVRRGDLKSTMLAVVAPTVLDTRSELEWDEGPNGGLVLVGGQSLDILKDFRDSMNFRFTIVQGDWLGRHANGSSTGKSAEMLKSNQVDLMIGQTVPISSRTDVLEYLLPTSINSLRAFVQQPPSSYSLNIFTMALGLPLLMALISSITLLLISLHITSRTLSTRVNVNAPLDHLHKVGESIMWIIGMFTQQGSHLTPNRGSLRVIFTTASLTGLVCYIAYAAVIVSVLSMENLPIRSLKDLFQSNLPMYASEDSILINEVLTTLEKTGKVRRRIDYLPVNLGVHLTFLKPTSYIIYAHQFHAERQKQGVSDRVTCDVIFSYQLTQVPLPSSMAVPKQSPFRKYFNQQLSDHFSKNSCTKTAWTSSSLHDLPRYAQWTIMPPKTDPLQISPWIA